MSGTGAGAVWPGCRGGAGEGGPDRRLGRRPVGQAAGVCEARRLIRRAEATGDERRRPAGIELMQPGIDTAWAPVYDTEYHIEFLQMHCIASATAGMPYAEA
jgi:hypothetical protein